MNAIEIVNLSKRYEIGALQQADQLREALVAALPHPFCSERKAPETIWALSDVSFSAEQGEVILRGTSTAACDTIRKWSRTVGASSRLSGRWTD